MKSMVIGGILLVVVLMLGTYVIAGDAFQTDDYINMLTMIGAFAIITITVATALKYINQMKSDRAGGELADENWDGIGEYKNAIPSGWGIIFIGSIIWMLWYFFFGYPTNQFSQIGQYNEEVLGYNEKFKEQFANPNEDTLKAMGESVFLVQCAPCHGVDAMGINGKAQDLTKRISKEAVAHAVKNGSKNFTSEYPAGMPAGLLADPKAIDEVATYVAGGLKGTAPASFASCAGCHGANGEGMPKVAPNLKAYSDEFVATVLTNGKKGHIGAMPSFKGRLNETQEKALATYIRSIKGE